MAGIIPGFVSSFIVGYQVIQRHKSWIADQIINYGVTTEAVVTRIDSARKPSKLTDYWCYVAFMVNNVKYEDRIELYSYEANMLRKNQKVRVTYSSRNPNLAILTDRVSMRRKYQEQFP